MNEPARKSEPYQGSAPTSAAPSHLRSLAAPPHYPLVRRDAPDVLPKTDERTPWLEGPLKPLGRPLTENTFVDVAIVGAGYTGLMCAHSLARLRPQWRILVIDALRVGEAASGRSSGYLMDVGHWQDGWDLEVNEGVTQLSERGLALLRELALDHRIDCDWHEGGRYHVAVNNRGSRALGHFREGMKAMGRPFEELPAEELARRLGTAHYTEGFRVEGGALVNPAALIRGLAEALPESVRLVERSPVERVDTGTPHRISVGPHFVQTPRLVLASNGFLPSLGVQRGKVLPFVTYASVTEPLDAAPGTDPQWGVVPEERMGATVRLTKDNRILIRNGVRYRRQPQIGEAACAAFAKDHRKSLARRFPELADVPFTHTWGGALGVTMNNATVFGRVGDQAWACGAHNGVGMTLGASLGDVLAHEIAAEPHPLRDQAHRLPNPAWMPPEPFLTLGIGMYTWFLGILAGAEK